VTAQRRRGFSFRFKGADVRIGSAHDDGDTFAAGRLVGIGAERGKGSRGSVLGWNAILPPQLQSRRDNRVLVDEDRGWRYSRCHPERDFADAAGS
jgi:ribosomal protein L3